MNKRRKKKESVKQLEVYIGHNWKESKAYDRGRYELERYMARKQDQSFHLEWKRGWPNRYRKRTAQKSRSREERR